QRLGEHAHAASLGAVCARLRIAQPSHTAGSVWRSSVDRTPDCPAATTAPPPVRGLRLRADPAGARRVDRIHLWVRAGQWQLCAGGAVGPVRLGLESVRHSQHALDTAWRDGPALSPGRRPHNRPSVRAEHELQKRPPEQRAAPSRIPGYAAGERVRPACHAWFSEALSGVSMRFRELLARLTLGLIVIGLPLAALGYQYWLRPATSP